MNAAGLAKFGERSAKAGEALWPAVVRIDGGAELAAGVTEPRSGEELVPGGQYVTGSLVARIRYEVLAEKPALEVTLEWKRAGETGWRPEKWRIDEVTGAPVDGAWTLRCGPRN